MTRLKTTPLLRIVSFMAFKGKLYFLSKTSKVIISFLASPLYHSRNFSLTPSQHSTFPSHCCVWFAGCLRIPPSLLPRHPASLPPSLSPEISNLYQALLLSHIHLHFSRQTPAYPFRSDVSFWSPASSSERLTLPTQTRWAHHLLSQHSLLSVPRT